MPTGLSPTLQTALALVRSRREAQEWIGPEAGQIVELLGELPPEQVARADAAIADAAGLYRSLTALADTRLFGRVRSDNEQLLRDPKLASLFIFHRDGRLREAALKHMGGGLPSPFLFAAVAWRLNDWAAPVREAAVACAARCFPQTSPDVVALSATALLGRRHIWSRWGAERDVLDQAFGRSDVAVRLANLLIGQTTGPVASVLRAALRIPALDAHLMRVAQDAVQPSGRAVALKALIHGKASWPSGYGWRWIDKSMGERRQEIVYAERDLTVVRDRDVLIRRGLQDRSAAVRRVALDGAMQYWKGQAELRRHAVQLSKDRSPAVRERAEFIMRQQTD
jgi:hypothetical protein